ncbi:MAG: crossover junction endodeoxyribonuclease RuvC [Bacteroidota bacterium]|nr:crossover junction endodeoxyribonuclease RuvC [Bacteroidota bacterium]
MGVTISKDVEQIILGIDPGTNVMGYGIIEVRLNQIKLIQYGVLHISKFDKDDIALRLKKIFDRTSQLIEEYTPDYVALEAPFFGKNIQSMLKLGRAQGVALAAALSRNIPVVEYAPKKVKQSVTGNGNASKEQVAAMVMRIFNIKEQPELLDATDALAVALCHHYQGKGVFSKSKTTSWQNFVSENPSRVKK